MSVPEGKVKVLSLNNRLNILGFKCLVFSLEGGPVMTFGSIFGNLRPMTDGCGVANSVTIFPKMIKALLLKHLVSIDV